MLLLLLLLLLLSSSSSLLMVYWNNALAAKSWIKTSFTYQKTTQIISQLLQEKNIFIYIQKQLKGPLKTPMTIQSRNLNQPQFNQQIDLKEQWSTVSYFLYGLFHFLTMYGIALFAYLCVRTFGSVIILLLLSGTLTTSDLNLGSQLRNCWES